MWTGIRAHISILEPILNARAESPEHRRVENMRQLWAWGAYIVLASAATALKLHPEGVTPMMWWSGAGVLILGALAFVAAGRLPATMRVILVGVVLWSASAMLVLPDWWGNGLCLLSCGAFMQVLIQDPEQPRVLRAVSRQAFVLARRAARARARRRSMPSRLAAAVRMGPGEGELAGGAGA